MPYDFGDLDVANPKSKYDFGDLDAANKIAAPKASPYPDNSTGHLAEATAELGKSFMAAPNRTIATIPYGIGEAAAQLGTGIGSAAVGGFRGLYAGAKSLLAGKDTDAATQADTDAIQRTMQAGIYQPHTASGKYLSANLIAPFEAAKEASQYGVGAIGGALQGVGTAIGTGAGALSTGKTLQQAFDEAIAAGAEAQMRGKGRLAGETIGNIVPDVVGTILGGRAAMRGAPAVQADIVDAARAAPSAIVDAARNVQAKAAAVQVPKAQDFIDSYKENQLAKQEAAAIASRNALPSSETAQLAVDEGYKLNPAKTNPTIGNRTLENVIGDSRLHNAAFKTNQERANLGARNQLGVGNGVGLDSALFDKVKEKATEPYREIEKIPEIPTDETFLNNIQGGSWIKSLPAEQQALFKNSPAINDMIETASLPSYTGLAAIKYITKLRNEANATFRSAAATDESTALANTKWSIARELESNIGRQLEKMDAANPNKGYVDLANRLKEGRQKYAEASTIENATTNGNVDVLKLAKDKRGDSFTGELDLMKRLGESHPEVFKKHGTTIPEIIKRYGIGGIGGGLVGAAVGGGPGFYAGTLIGGGLDPILSSLIKRRMLSEPFQNKNVVPFDARPIREQLGYGQVEEQPTQTVPAKPVYSDAQYAADFAEYKPYMESNGIYDLNDPRAKSLIDKLNSISTRDAQVPTPQHVNLTEQTDIANQQVPFIATPSGGVMAGTQSNLVGRDSALSLFERKRAEYLAGRNAQVPNGGTMIAEDIGALSPQGLEGQASAIGKPTSVNERVAVDSSGRPFKYDTSTMSPLEAENANLFRAKAESLAAEKLAAQNEALAAEWARYENTKKSQGGRNAFAEQQNNYGKSEKSSSFTPQDDGKLKVDNYGFVMSDTGSPIWFPDQKSAGRGWFAANKSTDGQVFEIHNYPGADGFTIRQTKINETPKGNVQPGNELVTKFNEAKQSPSIATSQTVPENKQPIVNNEPNNENRLLSAFNEAKSKTQNKQNIEPLISPSSDRQNEVAKILQTRNRNTQASIEQMNDIANNPDADLLLADAKLTGGSPGVIDIANKGIAKNIGKTGRVTTENRKIPFKYAVVEADQLAASNHVDGSANADYTVNLDKLAALSNGRTAGLIEAYKRGKANDYRNAIANAQDIHGIDKKTIDDMKQPVLVRLIDESHITSNIGNESNVTGTAGHSASEYAKNDASQLTDIDKLTFNEDGTPTNDALSYFISKMPKEDRHNLAPDGIPTQQAIDRMLGASLWKAYGDKDLVKIAIQSSAQESRRLVSALSNVAPHMMKLENTGNFDIRQPLIEAFKELVSASRSGKYTVKQFAEQKSVLRHPETQDFLDFFARNSGSGKAMTEILKHVANTAKDAFDRESSSVDMFGGESATRRSVLDKLNTGDSPELF